MDEDWNVTYEGGFWTGRGRAGREITIGKIFRWRENTWYVPAAYACGKGLVVDLCVEVAPDRLRAFLEKWKPYLEQPHIVTREVRERMESENPMEQDFRERLWVNGRQLTADRSCGLGWIPPELLPEGERRSKEAKRVLDHYRLDPEKGWIFRRASLKWATTRKPHLRTLKLELEQRPRQFLGEPFPMPGAGESAELILFFD